MGSKRSRLFTLREFDVFEPGIALLLLIFITMGCRTAVPFPSANAQEAGWRVQHGQAVWKVNAKAPEIACDLTVATHPSAGTLIELTKTPFPLIVARVTTHRWQLEFPANQRIVVGSTPVPAKLRWPRHRVPLAVLQLVNLLDRQSPSKPWNFTQPDPHSFRIENGVTQESLEGFLDDSVSTCFIPLSEGGDERALVSALPLFNAGLLQ